MTWHDLVHLTGDLVYEFGVVSIVSVGMHCIPLCPLVYHTVVFFSIVAPGMQQRHTVWYKLIVSTRQPKVADAPFSHADVQTGRHALSDKKPFHKTHVCGESRQDCLNTCAYACTWNLHTLKFHTHRYGDLKTLLRMQGRVSLWFDMIWWNMASCGVSC